MTRMQKWTLGAAAAAWLAAPAILAAQPPEQSASRPAKLNITIGRDTTFYAEPVRPDGTIDYVAAINARCGREVTPENNAAIPLLQATGPEFVAKPIRQKVYEVLGMSPLPEEGPYFVVLHIDDQEQMDQIRKACRGPWKASDLPAIAKWLKENETALARCTTAVERSRYFLPLLSDKEPSSLSDAMIPSLVKNLSMGQALAARAMARLQNGDLPGMWADIRAARKLARLQGQGLMLLDRLVAIAIDAQACQAIIAAARHGNLTAADAKAALAEAASWPPMPDVADAVDRLERVYGLESLVLLARAHQGRKLAGALGNVLNECHPGMFAKGSWPQVAYAATPEDLAQADAAVDWNLALRTLNEDYDQIVAAMRQKTYALRQSEVKALIEHLDKDAEAGKDRYEPPDGVNRLLREYVDATPQGRDALVRRLVHVIAASAVTSVTFPSQIQDARSVWRALSEAVLALAACKAETGKYPAHLDDLAPRYVKAVPQDLFADGPLEYKPSGEGYVLYSIGPNTTDDGGSDEGDADDIIVRTAEE